MTRTFSPSVINGTHLCPPDRVSELREEERRRRIKVDKERESRSGERGSIRGRFSRIWGLEGCVGKTPL